MTKERNKETDPLDSLAVSESRSCEKSIRQAAYGQILPWLKLSAAYIRQYDSQDPGIALKIRHTMHVLNTMAILLQEEAIPVELHQEALLTALFHDIGRYEQYTRWQTFFDAQSTDHAALGVSILQQTGMLEGLEEPARKRILTAIGMHSALAIEEGLDEKTRLLCQLIRDADKIDILRVALEDDPYTVCGSTLEEIADMSLSPKVYQSLKEHRCVVRSDRRNGLDVWVTFYGFFYDLNFDASWKRIHTLIDWKQILRRVPFTHPETAAQMEEITKDIETQMQTHLQALS